MEGISAEAASLAGHLQLGKIIFLYDDNNISLDGPTQLAFTEDVLKRFDAYGWHTQRVQDGNDTKAIEEAIVQAQEEKGRPSIISVKTIIGFGSPLQGTSKVHGSPLGEENLRKTKEHLGWNPDESFVVPADVREHLIEPGQRGEGLQREWQASFDAYKKNFPQEAQQLEQAFRGELPEGWDNKLPAFGKDESLATRQASGKALEALKQNVQWLIGGSADLASSNDMPTKGDVSFQPGHYQNTNIWFGVREHAMGAILNGMASHHGVRVYGGTFLNFSDYMRGAIRLAALTEAPITYVFTHDSIGLGEDGPTHQPIEQVTSLRATPNLTVIRPADANETVEAWRLTMKKMSGPVALILTRQKLPTLTDRAQAEGLQRGAYTLQDVAGEPDLIFIATGSEVQLAVKAAAVLFKEGTKVRVVSMPSWELFEEQSQDYRDAILPPAITKRISIEAGVTQGWYKWIGSKGVAIGIDRFGLSAPGEEVMSYFGFTVENICAKARTLL